MTEAKKAAGLAKLREPFPANQISNLPKPYKADSQKGNCNVCGGYHGLPALHLDYVGHAALTDRFLDADPEWFWEPLALGDDGLPALDRNGGMWIKLTILGVTRLGYGDAQGKTGPNAVKETIGDALRNAGMRFGAALDLWHKGDLHDGQETVQAPEAKPAARRDAPADKSVIDALKLAIAKLDAGHSAKLSAKWREQLPNIERLTPAEVNIALGLIDAVTAEPEDTDELA